MTRCLGTRSMGLRAAARVPRAATLPRHLATKLHRAVSLDDLVGADKHASWHSKAQRSRSLEVDEQLNFRCLLHRQVGRLLTLENAAGIYTGLTVHVGDAASILKNPPRGGAEPLRSRVLRPALRERDWPD